MQILGRPSVSPVIGFEICGVAQKPHHSSLEVTARVCSVKVKSKPLLWGIDESGIKMDLACTEWMEAQLVEAHR